MKRKITHKEVVKILGDLKDSLPRAECQTCECYQGFLVQLEIEALEIIKDLTDPVPSRCTAVSGVTSAPQQRPLRNPILAKPMSIKCVDAFLLSTNLLARRKCLT
jgi:hypothetical protein